MTKLLPLPGFSREKGSRYILLVIVLFLAVSSQVIANGAGQWNLDANGINAINAWNEFGVDGNGVVIAIIGTGVNYTLPELADAYLGGYDFCSEGCAYDCNGEDFDPMDEYGHGTEMASSILSAVGTIEGVAPNAQYYAIKVGNDDGQSSVLVLAQAIEWALLQGDVDILFLGVKSYSYQLMGELLNASYEEGTIHVAPSHEAPFPGSAVYGRVIGTGSHTKEMPQEVIYGADFSTEILGPGEEILVLDLAGNAVYADDNVGVAAAQVAGALALMVEYNKTHSIGYSNSALRYTLNQGAVALNTGDPREGNGRADVYNALTLMENEWFIDCNAQFIEPNYTEAGLPGYFAGGPLKYQVTLSNNMPLDFTGHRNISDLAVTVSINYEVHDGNSLIDMNSIETFNFDLAADQNNTLSGQCTIDSNAAGGLIAMDVSIEVNDKTPKAIISQIAGADFALIREPCGQAVDFVPDKVVDFRDFVTLASWWLSDCSEGNSWCESTDLDLSTLVDYNDLDAFVECWLCRYP